MDEMSEEGIAHAERWYKDQPQHVIVLRLIDEVRRRRADSGRIAKVLAALPDAATLRAMAADVKAVGEACAECGFGGPYQAKVKCPDCANVLAAGDLLVTLAALAPQEAAHEPV